MQELIKMPRYLSPSAIFDWGDDGDIVKRSEFFVKRLAHNRPPRLPQTEPMAVGSGFDAYVKSELYYRLNGNYGPEKEYEVDGRAIIGPEFQKDVLFDVQVEPQNREATKERATACMEAYKKSGAFLDLFAEMELASTPPKFEFTVEGQVTHEKLLPAGIPMLGKPDLFFRTISGIACIYDWKVNGYMSKSAKSPAKGYKLCRDGWDYNTAKASRGGAIQVHKDYVPTSVDGISVNGMYAMEYVDVKWATQLAIYSWLLDSEIGAPIIAGIEQLCGKPSPAGRLVRVASHRAYITTEFQLTLLQKIKKIWTCISTGYIFPWLSRKDNDDRCEILAKQYTGFSDSPEDKKKADFMSRATRDQRPY